MLCRLLLETKDLVHPSLSSSCSPSLAMSTRESCSNFHRRRKERPRKMKKKLKENKGRSLSAKGLFGYRLESRITTYYLILFHSLKRGVTDQKGKNKNISAFTHKQPTATYISYIHTIFTQFTTPNNTHYKPIVLVSPPPSFGIKFKLLLRSTRG